MNQLGNGARVMSRGEEIFVADVWDASAEKRELDRRQAQLKEDIAKKCGSYSKRV